jgi:ATP-dependent DNA helicase RecG
MRGPGVFFGIQQSGFFKFKIADLISDGTLIKEARKAAFNLIKDDPKLIASKNAAIKKHFENNYQYILKGMTIG